MQEHTIEKVSSDPSDPLITSGVRAVSAKLTEELAGAGGVFGPSILHVVSVDIQPWIKGPNSPPADIGPRYQLKLNMVPYLITSATVPDEQVRRSLLSDKDKKGVERSTDDEGVLIRFEFYKLIHKQENRVVSCPEPDQNLILAAIDAALLQGIYDKLGKTKPLVIGASMITDVIRGLTGGRPKLIGISLGTIGDLSLGFLLDAGPHFAFSENPPIRLTDREQDWAIDIPSAFVIEKIRETVKARVGAESLGPRVVVADAVIFTFPADLSLLCPALDCLFISVDGHVDSWCGTFGWNLKGVVQFRPIMVSGAPPTWGTPGLGSGSGSTGPVHGLMVTSETVEPTVTANLGCAIWDGIVISVRSFFGLSTPSGGPSTSPCGQPVASLEFAPVEGDLLYGTDIVVGENGFYLGGRSTSGDKLFSRSAPTLLTCPWVRPPPTTLPPPQY